MHATVLKKHISNLKYIKENLGTKALIKATFRSSINIYHQFLHGDIDSRDTIIISGSPRGGTTWLMELLGTLPNYKPIFEPLHENWYPWVRQYKIPPRPYLSPDDTNETLEIYLSDVFSGKIIGYDFPLLPSTIKLFSFTYLKELHKELSANKILVKFINANRLLPWIATHFNLRGIFYIIRHPCATIASQMRTGAIGFPKYIENQVKKGDISLLKKILLKDMERMKLFDRQIINKINDMNKKEEILAAIWSIDNYIPLMYLKNRKDNKIYMILYEILVGNFNNEIEKIFRQIDYDVPAEAYKRYSIPSRMTNDYKNIGTLQQLSKWKKELSFEKIKNILRVVDLFGIDIYTEDPWPKNIKKYQIS